MGRFSHPAPPPRPRWWEDRPAPLPVPDRQRRPDDPATPPIFTPPRPAPSTLLLYRTGDSPPRRHGVAAAMATVHHTGHTARPALHCYYIGQTRPRCTYRPHLTPAPATPRRPYHIGQQPATPTATLQQLTAADDRPAPMTPPPIAPRHTLKDAPARYFSGILTGFQPISAENFPDFWRF